MDGGRAAEAKNSLSCKSTAISFTVLQPGSWHYKLQGGDTVCILEDWRRFVSGSKKFGIHRLKEFRASQPKTCWGPAGLHS